VTQLEDYLNNLLNESIEFSLARENSLFDAANEAELKTIILFGAGRLGRKILNVLRKLDIEPLAFADNNSGLWDKSIDGLKVYSPKDAVVTFGKAVSFIVAIRHPGFTFEQAKQQLRELNCEKTIPITALYWKYPGIFLPHYYIDLPHKILESEAEIRGAFYLFEDEYSKTEYLAQLRYRLFLNQEWMQLPDHENQYFPQGLNLISQEAIFVDCGAYDGDTVKSFLSHAPSFKHIFAFEPDPHNYAMLREFVATLPSDIQSKITTSQIAIGEQHKIVHFNAAGTVEAAVTAGEGIDVDCVTLDETLQNWIPTYIKMDIEGSELDALVGAQKLIQLHKPALAICLYHHPDHLWSIPLFLHSIQKDYRFFLRPHDYEGWDLVCYAIPTDRLKV